MLNTVQEVLKWSGCCALLLILLGVTRLSYAQSAADEITQIRWSEQNSSNPQFIISHKGIVSPSVERQSENRIRLRFSNTVIPSNATNLDSRGSVIGVFPQQDRTQALVDIVTNDSSDVIVRRLQQNLVIEVVAKGRTPSQTVAMHSLIVNQLPNDALAIEFKSDLAHPPKVSKFNDGLRVRWDGVRLGNDYAVYEEHARRYFDGIRVISRNPVDLEFTLRDLENSDVLAIDGGYVIILQRKNSGRSPTMSLDFKELSAAEILRAIIISADLKVSFESLPETPLSLVVTDVTPYKALELIAQKAGAKLGYDGRENRWLLTTAHDTTNYRVFSLRYARAEELAPILTAHGSATMQPDSAIGSHSNDTNANSESGLWESATTRENPNKTADVVVRADVRSNSLFINGTPSQLNAIAKMLETLDRPQTQVEVEALIVEVDKDYAKSLGVQWGGRRVIDYPNMLGYKGANRAALSGNGSMATNGQTSLSESERVVNLPAQGLNGESPARVGLSWIASQAGLSDFVNVQLSALEANGHARVLASPRLMTSNHYPASIEQGVERFFDVSTDEDAELVSKRAVLGIEVTPHVFAGGEIQMDLVVKQDSFDAMDTSAMHTKRIASSIRARNNQTIVLGGIYQKEEFERGSAVPGISKVPLAKWLFSNSYQNESVRELIVLLTPSIRKTPEKSIKILPFGHPVLERS